MNDLNVCQLLNDIPTSSNEGNKHEQSESTAGAFPSIKALRSKFLHNEIRLMGKSDSGETNAHATSKGASRSAKSGNSVMKDIMRDLDLDALGSVSAGFGVPDAPFTHIYSIPEKAFPSESAPFFNENLQSDGGRITDPFLEAIAADDIFGEHSWFYENSAFCQPCAQGPGGSYFAEGLGVPAQAWSSMPSTVHQVPVSTNSAGLQAFGLPSGALPPSAPAFSAVTSGPEFSLPVQQSSESSRGPHPPRPAAVAPATSMHPCGDRGIPAPAASSSGVEVESSELASESASDGRQQQGAQPDAAGSGLGGDREKAVGDREKAVSNREKAVGDREKAADAPMVRQLAESKGKRRRQRRPARPGCGGAGEGLGGPCVGCVQQRTERQSLESKLHSQELRLAGYMHAIKAQQAQDYQRVEALNQLAAQLKTRDSMLKRLRDAHHKKPKASKGAGAARPGASAAHVVPCAVSQNASSKTSASSTSGADDTGEEGSGGVGKSAKNELANLRCQLAEMTGQHAAVVGQLREIRKREGRLQELNASLTQRVQSASRERDAAIKGGEEAQRSAKEATVALEAVRRETKVAIAKTHQLAAEEEEARVLGGKQSAKISKQKKELLEMRRSMRRDSEERQQLKAELISSRKIGGHAEAERQRLAAQLTQLKQAMVELSHRQFTLVQRNAELEQRNRQLEEGSGPPMSPDGGVSVAAVPQQGHPSYPRYAPAYPTGDASHAAQYAAGVGESSELGAAEVSSSNHSSDDLSWRAQPPTAGPTGGNAPPSPYSMSFGSPPPGAGDRTAEPEDCSVDTSASEGSGRHVVENSAGQDGAPQPSSSASTPQGRSRSSVAFAVTQRSHPIPEDEPQQPSTRLGSAMNSREVEDADAPRPPSQLPARNSNGAVLTSVSSVTTQASPWTPFTPAQHPDDGAPLMCAARVQSDDAMVYVSVMPNAEIIAVVGYPAWVHIEMRKRWWPAPEGRPPVAKWGEVRDRPASDSSPPRARDAPRRGPQAPRGAQAESTSDGATSMELPPRYPPRGVNARPRDSGSIRASSPALPSERPKADDPPQDLTALSNDHLQERYRMLKMAYFHACSKQPGE
ncbi:hypothetical protein CYMTET_52875 [Cymbomonas tetramitiformis]|uniref:Uncharacterized protein n=1 Tax=Cymbomonas tetramitiformis TaxID=36881 RepID=A0AAE0BJB1_9CHLO|nr:hypothetical protein CYMTET_52875 [Cymbomonas tetramitiformis]